MFASLVKTYIGQSGPRTEEKWRMTGTRLSSLRFSTITAAFEVDRIVPRFNVGLEFEVSGVTDGSLRREKPSVNSLRKENRMVSVIIPNAPNIEIRKVIKVGFLLRGPSLERSKDSEFGLSCVSRLQPLAMG